jgi:hypothetical protein
MYEYTKLAMVYEVVNPESTGTGDKLETATGKFMFRHTIGKLKAFSCVKF